MPDLLFELAKGRAALSPLLSLAQDRAATILQSIHRAKQARKEADMQRNDFLRKIRERKARERKAWEGSVWRKLCLAVQRKTSLFAKDHSDLAQAFSKCAEAGGEVADGVDD